MTGEQFKAAEFRFEALVRESYRTADARRRRQLLARMRKLVHEMDGLTQDYLQALAENPATQGQPAMPDQDELRIARELLSLRVALGVASGAEPEPSPDDDAPPHIRSRAASK